MSRRTAARVQEDAHHVSPASDPLVEALLRVVRPDLLPVGHGEGGEGQDIRAHVGQQFGGLREAFVEHTHHAHMLCVDLFPSGGSGPDYR